MSDDRAARAAARASWPVQMAALHDGSVAVVTGSVEVRLAAAWQLSVEAHQLAGMSCEPVPRDRWPVVKRRRSER
jgi:hypothetical protein